MLFQPGRFDDVAARAAHERKLFIAYFTGDQNEACEAIERSTWPDVRVTRFLEAHALVVKVENDAALTCLHDVQLLPTLLIFRDGEECDRHVGMIHAAGLVSWLDEVRLGRRGPHVRLRPSEEEVRRRHQLGRACIAADDSAAASEHLLWVWRNGPVFMRIYGGAGQSLLVNELQDLVRANRATRDALTRCAADARAIIVQRGPSLLALLEWVSLSIALDDTDACLGWLEALPACPEGVDALTLELAFGALARERGRLASLGRVYPAPQQVLAQHRTMRALFLSMEEPLGLSKDVLLNMTFRENAARAHSAYVAANRASDARAFARGARAIDPIAWMRRRKPAHGDGPA